MSKQEQTWNEFDDELNISLPTELVDGVDNLTSTSRLIVTIDASHAGVLNGNQRLYRPDMVKRGAFSMIDKPFIKHHDEASDPIGVIIDSGFVNIASDEFKAAHRNFMSNKFWREDVPWDEIFELSPQGLGKLVAKAQVTDLDAIEKILDKRFMGVSIKFRTDKMGCSCGKDKGSMMAIMFGGGGDEDEDVCMHMPGETDSDGLKHFNVAGELRFPHLSVVNEPADPKAKIVTTDCIDMVVYDSSNSGKTYSKYIVDTEGNDEVVDDNNNFTSDNPDTLQEGQSMDRSELLNDSIVKELLAEALTEGKDSRQSEVDELTAKLEVAENSVEFKTETIQGLSDEVEGLTKTLIDELASSLVEMRDLDSDEESKAQHEMLSKRTISSLRDSIEDERNNTAPASTEDEDPDPTADKVVDDPGTQPAGEGEDNDDDDVVEVEVGKYNIWMHQRDAS